MKFPTDLFNHHRYTLVCLFLIAVLAIFWIGCQSKCRSMENPDVWITRQQLLAELQSYQVKSESDLIKIQAAGGAKITFLDRQDSFKRWVAEQAALYTETGAINPGGLVLSLIGLFGLGATVDVARKPRPTTAAAPPEADGA